MFDHGLPGFDINTRRPMLPYIFGRRIELFHNWSSSLCQQTFIQYFVYNILSGQLFQHGFFRCRKHHTTTSSRSRGRGSSCCVGFSSGVPSSCYYGSEWFSVAGILLMMVVGWEQAQPRRTSSGEAGFNIYWRYSSPFSMTVAGRKISSRD